MFGILRRNPGFARLWTAQVVSQAGDWLSRMAVLALIGELSGTAAALGVGAFYGAELALRLLPSSIMGPIAGPIADRLPRRTLMLTADLVRAALVLCLLLIREPDDLPWLYVLVGLQMGTAVFFEAARAASVPNTVGPGDLHAANTLSALTWSVMLSVGALLGGVLVAFVGTRGVFLLDALTYLISAWILLGLSLPPPPTRVDRLHWKALVTFTEMRDGWAHARSRGLGAIVFCKAAWGGAGGYLVALALAGRERFTDEVGGPLGAEAGTVAATAGAIGLLYAARGVGTGIGPLLARWVSGSTDEALRKQASAGFLIGAGGYALFAPTTSLAWAIPCIVFAHMGGSIIWVASTTLWQRHVEDAYRGRIHALEMLGMTFAFSVGGWFAGWLYDFSGSLEPVLYVLSGIVFVCGILWTTAARRVTRRRGATGWSSTRA